ncbi:MAG: lamin tail domain-containing protein [Anaerolineae bacterium]
MSSRGAAIISLLRRLGKERTVLPIGGGLSVSLLELQALLFLIGSLVCSCCSISSYVWGSAGLRRAEPVPVGTSRPAGTPTHTPVAIGTPAAMSTDTDTDTTITPPAETTTPTSTPRPMETPVPPAPIQPPASTVTIQSPIPIPTLAPTPTPTPAQSPIPTDTPRPTPTPPTLTPTATNTPAPTSTSTPSPTTAPSSDLYIAHVEYNLPLEGEYVLIKNRGAGSQDMTGWTLWDEQSHAYLFPDNFILPAAGASASVRVWTKSDKDTATDLYWGLDNPVWGNSDTARLLDDTRNEVDSLEWP